MYMLYYFILELSFVIPDDCYVNYQDFVTIHTIFKHTFHVSPLDLSNFLIDLK